MNYKKHISKPLLAWYDTHARDLPWRISPSKSITGVKQEPYKVWLSEIMLQQTTVKAVIPYYQKFTSKWKNIEQLAKAQENEIMEAWAGLGYYSRARNLIKCSRLIIEKHDSTFPQCSKLLLKLPGVGPYTAAAIQSIAFGKKAVVLDGNIERVIVRLYAIMEPIKYSKKELRNIAETLTPSTRCGDYAQSLMDLGATICTPKQPNCDICPITSYCNSFEKKIASELPRKVTRGRKVRRYGFAFVVTTKDHRIILERRPKRGLLGGMLSFPCSDWTKHQFPKFAPPFNSSWTIHSKIVTHQFSHFELSLQVATCNISNTPKGFLTDTIRSFNSSSLPSLMRKVYAVASNQI